MMDPGMVPMDAGATTAATILRAILAGVVAVLAYRLWTWPVEFIGRARRNLGRVVAVSCVVAGIAFRFLA